VHLESYIGEFYELADTNGFALPVYSENGEVERYNMFHESVLIRHANDDKFDCFA
jgi:hypothetical protein